MSSISRNEPGQPWVRIRGRGGPAAPHMEKVNLLAVDLGQEVGQRIDPRLDRPPVEPRPPVLGELAQKGQRAFPLPSGARELVRPAGPRQPLAEILEHGLRNGGAEGSDVHRHSAGWNTAGIQKVACLAWPRTSPGSLVAALLGMTA